jgi:hypothetical protein
MGRQDDGIVIVAENNEKMFISHVTIQCSAFLEKLIVNQLVKKLSTFMQLERCSGKSITGLYPEPDESSTHFHTIFF